MKRIILPLLCVIAIQSCAILEGEKSFSCLGVKICKIDSTHPYLNEDVLFLVGVGKATIRGDSSWNDPLSGQLALEQKVFELNENSSFYSGLGISYQGSSYEEQGFSGVVRLSYVSMPLLFNYESKCGIYGEIGLQPGFLLFARDKIAGSRESWSYGDFVKNFELGLPLGVGYRLNDQFRLGIRATYGITNMQNWGSDIRNHNLLITGVAGYRLKWEEWIKK